MKHGIGRIGVLALVLVLCLATLGIGYARWSDNLNIDGSIDTGVVAVSFNDCKSNDPPGDSDDPRECGTWTFPDIYVPATWTCDADRFAFDEATTECDIEGTDRSLLTITMAEGYPGYCAHVAFSVKNEGTVPVEVDSIQLTRVSKETDFDEVTIDLVKDVTKYVYVDETGKAHIADSLQTDGAGNVISEFSLTLSELALDQQIDPVGAGISAIPGDLCYQVELGANSGTTYDFTVAIVAGQYNE